LAIMWRCKNMLWNANFIFEQPRALVGSLRSFLTELGGDFAFVGSQYRLEVGGQEYFIDLLLFHRRLRCLVAVELKIGDFKPEHKGKIEFYLEALDTQERIDGENSPIGIIVCRSKNKTVVEYALRTAGRDIGVASYSIVPQLPEDYRDQLPSPEGERYPDALELIEFIESITHPTEREQGEWSVGPRDMVDMLVMVQRYYFDPRMQGSNSIKQVLPAVLNASDFLQQKYQRPVHSLNFTNQVWLKQEGGEILDPYKLLPTLFEGFSAKDRALLLSNDGEPEQGSSIHNGGAAMTAFARMQFTEMTEKERVHLRAMLLKYCELDTLAMVMIFEAWRAWFQG